MRFTRKLMFICNQSEFNTILYLHYLPANNRIFLLAPPHYRRLELSQIFAITNCNPAVASAPLLERSNTIAINPNKRTKTSLTAFLSFLIK